MKKVYTGYVGKSFFYKNETTLNPLFEVIQSPWTDFPVKVILPSKNGGFPDIYLRKGKKNDWDEQDWPPKKITITVEY